MSDSDPKVPDYLSLVKSGDADRDWEDMREQLAHGGGTSGGDGLESRVARLEASVAHIERDIGELKTDFREFRADMRDTRDRLAKLEERVSHLPGKGFVVSALILTLAVITGITVFQSRIESFVARPSQSPTTQPGSP